MTETRYAREVAYRAFVDLMGLTETMPTRKLPMEPLP
jgi:hypothetical protein